MAEPCARIVARDDPALHATALFAPDPVRGHLMVLYAYDVELSRATRASKESLIPRMRLQWWRDILRADQPPAHEVAGPLVALIRDGVLAAPDLAAMADGHEAELDLPFTPAAAADWAENRFARRTALAAAVLGGPVPARAVAPVLGLGFGLRTAMACLGNGGMPFLALPPGADAFAARRGDIPETLSRAVADQAGTALAALAEARRQAPRAGRAIAALLPLAREERVLRLAVRTPGAIFGQVDRVDRPFDGLRLAWRAATGRW